VSNVEQNFDEILKRELLEYPILGQFAPQERMVELYALWNRASRSCSVVAVRVSCQRIICDLQCFQTKMSVSFVSARFLTLF